MRLLSLAGVVGAALLLVACGSTEDDSTGLLDACWPGAQLWDGAPIAAFADPANDDRVICWADGRVPRSPPPDPDGEPTLAFDRVVFTATRDGQVIEMARAGYRDHMPVSPLGRRDGPARRENGPGVTGGAVRSTSQRARSPLSP